MTQSAVRLCLTEEETRDLQGKSNMFMQADISPLILISSGLDIQELYTVRVMNEEQMHLTFTFTRRWLASNITLLKICATNLQKSNITVCHNALQRRIDAWKAQLLYMPAISALHAIATGSGKEYAYDGTIRLEEVKLWLLSELGLSECTHM